MNSDRLQHYRILARTLGVQDATLEPIRASRQYCGDGRQAIDHNIVRWERMLEYRESGATYLAQDRSQAGRQESSRLLGDMTRQGLVRTHFVAGRPQRLKLTPAGDHRARFICLQPTIESSGGIFHRLCSLLDGRPVSQHWPQTIRVWRDDNWFRRDHLSEFALSYPDGTRSLEPTNGVAGPVTLHIMPWLVHEYVTFHSDKKGNVFYQPTDAGWEHYRDTDWSATDLDWHAAWHRQMDAAMDELGDQQASELGDLFCDSFTRERDGLRMAEPTSKQELYEIPWPASD